MIPLKLTLEGIYSYQKRQEIDFSRLTSSHLFGIFGSTGSGKSTILEAISLALYGESERLNARDQRGYNMMNLRSDTLYIDFLFESGGQRYRFAVKGRRNRKQFEQVASFERQAYRYEGETPVPLPSSDAEAILGLSYDNFRRTVIIPQGKFQEFLQLGETERTRMLKDIFRLDQFDLYDQAASLERKNELLISEQQARLYPLEQATPEAAESLREETAQLRLRLENERQQAPLLEQSLRLMEEARKLFEALAQERAALARLQAQEESFRSRRERLRQTELCIRDFRPLIQKRRETEAAIGASAQTARLKRESQEKSQSELRSAERVFASVEEEFINRHRLHEQAEDFETLLQLRSLSAQAARAEERIRNGKQKLEENQRTLDLLQQKQQALANQISSLRAQQADLGLLLELQQWFDRRQQLREDAARTQLARQRLEEQSRSLAEAWGALSQSVPGLDTGSDETRLRSRAGELIREAEAREQEAERRKRLLSLEEALAEARSLLAEGQPCLLCGSTHHPGLAHDSSADIRWEGEMQAARQQIRLLQNILLQADTLAGRSDLIQVSREEAEQQDHGSQLLLEQHLQRFPAGPFAPDDEARVRSLISQSQAQDKQLRQWEEERKAADQDYQRQQEQRQQFLGLFDQLSAEKQQAELALASARSRLRHEFPESHAQSAPAELEALAEQKRKAYEGIEASYDEYKQRIQRLRSQLDQVSGELAEVEKQEKSQLQELAAISSSLYQAAEQSPFPSLQAIEAILAQPLDLEPERAEIEQFFQQLHAAEEACRKIELQMRGLSYDPEAHQALSSSLQQLRLQSEELTRQSGAAETRLRQMEADLELKARLAAGLEKLLARRQNIATLKNVLKASGFVNYISTVYLTNLCEAANLRFARLTRGQLMLETTPDNRFQVRDYLHKGLTRSVKTLSGGQTFQAALSLALALSDQIQQQVQAPQQFFFLDEGFGSQDKQSLQLIFETLRSLRKENRIVGIISHVEELQQEIQTALLVVNDPEQGSIIHPSWQL
jgi:exonuclease SbcC